MATVRLMPTARGSLEALLTRELPGDARERIRERLRQLETFPESGPSLDASEWEGARTLFGQHSELQRKPALKVLWLDEYINVDV